MEIIRKLFEYIANEYNTAVLAGETLKFFASVISIVVGVLGIPVAITAFFKFWFQPLVTFLTPKKKMQELEKLLENSVDFDAVWNDERIKECLQAIFNEVDKQYYTKKRKIAAKSYLKAKLGWLTYLRQEARDWKNYPFVDWGEKTNKWYI